MTESLYTSRLIDVAPSDVAGAFDQMRRGGDRYVIDVPGGRLELLEERPVVSQRNVRYVPIRSTRGILRVGRVRSYDVDVELLPWSASQTELAVRPAGRVRTVSDRYFEVAGAAMECIATTVAAFDRDSVEPRQRTAA